MDKNYLDYMKNEYELWNYIFTQTSYVNEMMKYVKEKGYLSEDSDYLDLFMFINRKDNDRYDRYNRKEDILKTIKQIIKKEKQEIIDEFEKYKQTHHEVSAVEQLKLEIIKSMLAGGTNPQEIDPDSVEDLAMKLLGVEKRENILKINMDGENE